MNKKQLAKFEKLLLQEKDSVLAHLNELKGVSEQQLEQGPGDQVDIASTEITQAALQKIGSRERKLLSKIDYSLQKIKNGDYGVCENCGEDIAVARLEARPIALYCIDCKTAQEHRERQYSDDEEAEEQSSWSGGEASEDMAE